MDLKDHIESKYSDFKENIDFGSVNETNETKEDKSVSDCHKLNKSMENIFINSVIDSKLMTNKEFSNDSNPLDNQKQIKQKSNEWQRNWVQLVLKLWLNSILDFNEFDFRVFIVIWLSEKRVEAKLHLGERWTKIYRETRKVLHFSSDSFAVRKKY